MPNFEVSAGADLPRIGLRSPQAFTFEPPSSRIVFGAGVAGARLVEELEALGLARIVVVHSESGRALVDRILAPHGELIVGRFSGVRPHVPIEVAEAARRLAVECGADGVVSIGGGSVTGTAKAIAMTTSLPLVALPTTYSGSEVTPIWGVTTDGHKETGRDPKVLPRTVLYDPELSSSLPSAVAIASGFNAFAHCVETFYAPGANPVTALIAEEGIRTLTAGTQAVADGGMGREGREALLYGAYLAGSAFAVSGSGLHHKICHVLGGRFDLPHAETHTALLPQVLGFNEPSMPRVAERIRRAIATAFTPAAEGAAAATFDLIEATGGSVKLSDPGASGPELEAVAAEVVAAVPPGNPRTVTAADILAILAAAFEGRRPFATASSVGGRGEGDGADA